MLKKILSKALITAFVITNILSCYPSMSFAKGVQTSTAPATDREKTEIIVKYKNENQSESVKTRTKSSLKLSKLDTKKNFKDRKTNLLEIDKKDDISKVVAELKKDPNVEYVQPNYPLETSSADAMFNKQWGLLNNGQDVEGATGRSNVDINAVNAWNLTQGSSTVVVGVLDTGIDITHNDLKDSIYINTTEIPGNGIDDDHNGYVDDVNGWDFVNNDNTVYDDSGKDLHGTQVAGVLAAKQDTVGVTGLAPNIKLMPLKFINGMTGYTCDAIDAIEYAMSMGVKIINCSFGGGDNNFALKDTMANSGILFVCAAGNRGQDVNISPVYPACFDLPNILSVAAIDSKGVIANFSSFGSKIQVAAPGVSILTTTPGNTYDYLSGTSVATPFATATAALLKSYLHNLTVTQIADRIKQNVVPAAVLTGKVSTGGRIDAYAALTNTQPAADTYNGPGNNNGTVPPGQKGGDLDTWYTMDQLAKIKEQLHYGESGVNPASGNFSFSVTDMTIPAPGFTVNLSRTYNSKDDKSTPLGSGWTFGFEGSAKGTDLVTVSLPSGAVERYRKNADGTFAPEDSRSTFVKNADNTYTLTTKDQYTYYFDANGWLNKMKDRNGNAVTILVDANGKISKITDTVGRNYVITYSTANPALIANIKDPENRLIQYTYDSNSRLTTVTDANGGKMNYFYDGYGFINKITDHYDKVVENLVYQHSEGENNGKVSQATDSLACTVNYSYDMTNRKTTITDMNGRLSVVSHTFLQ